MKPSESFNRLTKKQEVNNELKEKQAILLEIQRKFAARMKQTSIANKKTRNAVKANQTLKPRSQILMD